MPTELTAQDEIKELREEAAKRRRELREAERQRDDALAEIETYKTKVSGLETKVTDLETKNSERDKQEELKTLAAQVAQEKGVPESLLRGTTKEELEAFADEIKPLIAPRTPIVPKVGDTPTGTTDSEAIEFVKGLFGDE